MRRWVSMRIQLVMRSGMVAVRNFASARNSGSGSESPQEAWVEVQIAVSSVGVGWARLRVGDLESGKSLKDSMNVDVRASLLSG